MQNPNILKKFIFLLLTLIPLCSIAQKDWREGFIVTLANDTLRGLADYKENNSIFRSVKFKKTGTETLVEYSPKEISAYGFKGNRNFVSLEIPADSGKTQLVFSEILVKGLVSLYKFEKTYYINKDKGSLYELKNTKQTVWQGDRKYIVSLNEHISILTMLMNDCASLKAIKNGRVDYKQKALTELSLDYNSCKGEPSIEFTNDIPFFNFSLSLAGGVSFSKLKSELSFPDYYYWLGSFETSISPEAGMLLDISFPRMSERFSFNTGILATKHSYKSLTKRLLSDYEERNYTTFALTQLNIPFAIKYTFPERFLTPYVFGGASLTVNRKTSASWRKETRYLDDDVDITETQPLVFFHESQGALLFGLGGTIKLYKKTKIFLEVRYEWGDGAVNYPRHFVDNFQNVHVLAGLKFF